MNRPSVVLNHLATPRRRAFSLVELFLALSIVVMLSAAFVTSMRRPAADARQRACDAAREALNVRASLYFTDSGEWPSRSMSELFRDEPKTLCPVDGASYVFDRRAQSVVAHQHRTTP